jgi:hypothetical protein
VGECKFVRVRFPAMLQGPYVKRAFPSHANLATNFRFGLTNPAHPNQPLSLSELEHMDIMGVF